MPQLYSEPSRASEPTALPDVEVFYLDSAEIGANPAWRDDDGEPLAQGWYYWFCFPGCLPDSEPSGPFKTRASAVQAVRS